MRFDFVVMVLYELCMLLVVIYGVVIILWCFDFDLSEEVFEVFDFDM